MRLTGLVLTLGLITAAASGQDATGQASRLSSPQTKLVKMPAVREIAASNQATIEWVRANHLDAICRVRADAGGGTQHIGTGCYIGNGWVLSAAHVTKNYPVTVEFQRESLRVVDKWKDRYGDSVVLKLEREPANVKPPEIAYSDPVGERVVLAGFDRGERLRIYDGIWDNSNETTMQGGRVGTVSEFGSSAGVSGNSGGPVFDSSGRLVGNVWGSTDPNGVDPGRNVTKVSSNGQIHAFVVRVSQQVGQQIVPWGNPQPQQCQPGQQCPPGYQPIQPQPIQPQPCQPDEATIQALVDARVMQLLNDNPITLQPSYRDTDGTLKPDGEPIIARLGDRVPLPPVKLEVTSVDGRKSYSQGPLGGTMRVMMGEVK